MGPVRRASTVGRPRLVTDEQVRLILEWHDALLAWRAQHPTLAQLARNLGLTRGTVYSVVMRRGEYKRACPSQQQPDCT